MIGSHIAKLLATDGVTQVALFSRSPGNLARDAAFITTASPCTTFPIHAADVTTDNHFASTLEKAVGGVGSPKAIVYNAARINLAQEEFINPGNIANKFWELYQQERGSRQFEMKCGW